MAFTCYIQNFQTAAVATGNGTPQNVSGYSRVGFQVKGVTTATVSFEGTINGVDWVALSVVPLAGGAAVTTATADGIFTATVSGITSVRARISAWTSGTITVSGLISEY